MVRDFTPGTFNVSLQDRDLLQRLNLYFDALETHLQSGEGWLIFNARSGRDSRIARYIQQRVADAPSISAFVVPWRDFSLTAYMVEVELQSAQARLAGMEPKHKREVEIANKVSQQTMIRMVTDDLLIVPGVSVRHSHEVRYLSATILARYNGRLATILLTPDSPHDLEGSITRHSDTGSAAWRDLSQRLFATSFLAL